MDRDPIAAARAQFGRPSATTRDDPRSAPIGPQHSREPHIIAALAKRRIRSTGFDNCSTRGGGHPASPGTSLQRASGPRLLPLDDPAQSYSSRQMTYDDLRRPRLNDLIRPTTPPPAPSPPHHH